MGTPFIKTLDTIERTLGDADPSVVAQRLIDEALVGDTSNASPHPGLRAGGWYIPFFTGSHGSGVAAVKDSIRGTLGYVPSKCRVNKLGARITTATGAINLQFAIYGVDEDTKLPKGLKASTGDVSSTSGAAVVNGSLTADFDLPAPGWYWFCANAAGTTASWSVYTSADPNFLQLFGGDTLDTSAIGTTGLTTGLVWSSQTYGTWPDDLSGVAYLAATTVPVIAFSPSALL